MNGVFALTDRDEAELRRVIRSHLALHTPAEFVGVTVDLILHAVTSALRTMDEKLAVAPTDEVFLAATATASSLLRGRAENIEQAIVINAKAMGMPCFTRRVSTEAPE